MDDVSVRYIVDDVDAAVDFYSTHLAFARMRAGAGFAMLGYRLTVPSQLRAG